MLKRAFRRNLMGYALGMLTIAQAANAQDISCGNFLQADATELVRTVKWGGPQDGPPDVGCRSDAGQNNLCEWSSAVTIDRIIGERRLVIVNTNHETGSGAWDFVSIYGCVGGQVKAVLGKKFLYGAEVSKLTDDKIVLKSGDWSKHDPQCCASHETIATYGWDEKSQSYKLSGRILRVARDTPRE